MIKIEHIGVWVRDLETMKEFLLNTFKQRHPNAITIHEQVFLPTF